MPVLRRHDPLRVLIAAIAVVAAVLGGAGPARAGGFRSLIGAGGVRLPAHARDLRPLAGSTTVTGLRFGPATSSQMALAARRPV